MQRTRFQAPLFFQQSKPAGRTSTPDCLELIGESLSVSALAVPTPPLGFEVDIHYDMSKPLGPLGVYLCAVDFLYYFAQTGWYKELAGGFTIWVTGFNMEIDIENSQAYGGLVLQTSHIVLGLYDTITDVSTHSRFCELLTTLSLHGRQIGVLMIQKRTSSTANATNLVMVKGSPISNAVTYPSGQITDADNPDFSVFYTYSGIRINSKDIFLTVLAALATAAQFSPSRSFQSISASSPSGDCVISISEVGSPFPVNYSYITKTLRTLISDISVFLAKFGEMTFQLNWGASSMAEGSIKLVHPTTKAQEGRDSR